MSTGTGLAPSRAFRRLANTDPFRALQERMNRLFDESFGPLAFPGEESLSLSLWKPFCDIYETENEIVVKAELPDVKKEEVHVSIENNLLTISGERKFEEETKKENYHRIERRYGEFRRSFGLPTTIDAKKVSAEFKDGMLRVSLPKTEEAKPKQVEVKVK